MATVVSSGENGKTEEASVGELLTGIVGDARDLAIKHLELFQSEVRRDLQLTREAVIAVLLGAVLAQVGGLLLCHMLAHLLHQLPGVPLWAGYGIVGFIVAVGGTILLLRGTKLLKNLKPLSEGISQLKKDFGQ